MVVEETVDEHTLIADAVTFRFIPVAGVLICHRKTNVDTDGVFLVQLHRPLYFFDALNSQGIDVTIFHDQLDCTVFMDFDQFNRLVY